MIHARPFQTPAAVAEFFNAPDNAALRLVSVLPEGRGVTALYETAPSPAAELEAERQRLLEERILSLWQLDDGCKRRLGFPRTVLDAAIVPLSIVSNKLGHLSAFKDMGTRHRNEWIRENVAAVGCAYLAPDEAREHYDSAAELIRIEA